MQNAICYAPVMLTALGILAHAVFVGVVIEGGVGAIRFEFKRNDLVIVVRVEQQGLTLKVLSGRLEIGYGRSGCRYTDAFKHFSRFRKIQIDGGSGCLA